MKIFAGLVIIMLLCVALIVIIPYIGTARPSMTAEKLSNKPEKYFVVTDADPVLVQAISHLGKPISFDSLDETEIGDLAYQYGTSNIEYQNNYYSVGVLVSEPSPIHILTFWASIIGLIMSTALLIHLIIRKRTEMANTNEKAIFMKKERVTIPSRLFEKLLQHIFGFELFLRPY